MDYLILKKKNEKMKTQFKNFLLEKDTTYSNFDGDEVELPVDPHEYYFCIYSTMKEDELDDIYSRKENFMRSTGVIVVPKDYYNTYGELFGDELPNEIMHILHKIKLIEVEEGMYEDWEERDPAVIFELMLNLGFEYSENLQDECENI
jgi:hypothetical protein